jgi:hypothetical protein
MKKFKYGIMVVDPLNPEDVGTETVTVVHFVGYWEEPASWDIEADRLREELRTDPDFEYYRKMIDRLVFYPATEDCLKYYNEMVDDKKVWNEKSN